MKNYQVTIGYKAVIVVNVKADNESTAKSKAIQKLTDNKDKMFVKGIELQDDNYKADGVLGLWYY